VNTMQANPIEQGLGQAVTTSAAASAQREKQEQQTASAKPPAVKTVLAVFDAIDHASAAVSAIIARGLVPAAVEMIDQLTIQALDELAENPLGASLEVRAKQTSQYESIAKFLEEQQGSGAAASIDKVNFYQNKTAIDRLTNIIETSRRLGIGIALVLGIATLLISFNTIRLAIYTAREEIGVMNIVGAGHWYVRGPFMVAGVLYGLVSSIVVLILLYPILLYRPVLIGLDPTTELLFGSFNSFEYYTAHFLLFFVVLTGTAVALGALSPYLAVRRYLHT